MLVETNDTLLAMFSMTQSDVKDFNLETQFENKKDLYRFRELVEEGENVIDLEVVLNRKDGCSFDATLAISPISIDDKNVFIILVQDGTERNQAKQKLITSELQYRSIVESINDGMYAVSADLKVIHTNRIFRKRCRFLGIEGDLTNRNVSDILTYLPANLIQKNLEEFHKVFKSGAPIIREESVDIDSGRLVAEIRKIPVMIDGNVSQILTIIRNITHRRIAEDLIRDERDRAQLYLDIAGVMIVIVNSFGIVELINRKGCEILRYREEEIIGKHWFNHFLPVKSRDKVIASFQSVVAEGKDSKVYYENSVVTKGGSERLIAWHNSYLYDENGRATHVVSSGEDITDLKEAEKSLVESEKKYRSLVDNVPAVTYLSTIQEFSTIYISPQVEDILGISPDSFLSDPEFWQKHLHPEDRDRVIEEIRRSIETDTKFVSEYRFIDEKNEVIWLHDESRIIPNPNGEPYLYQGVLISITKRKQAEAEREELIVELENKNSELERFTYTVSHDLKSPLITIAGFIGLVEEDAQKGDMERMRADIQRINNATDKMQYLLDDLLRLSRIGRQSNPFENLWFTDLIKGALENLKGQIEASSVKIVVQRNLPKVFVDRLRIIEVIQNLVDNAIKYMGDRNNPCIEIGMRKRGNQDIFFVKDNGIGIKRRYHEKVFDLFEQLDVHVNGTGVGLAIVKRIIEIHKGEIRVDSEPGKGTTFFFTLKNEESN